MIRKVTKAVIPAAGLGTRFLPATKTVPKEMLPIVDQPILLYNIEECVRAGIEDVILVAGRGKTAIEDFFDTSYELEDRLRADGKEDLLERVASLKDRVNLISIRQKEAKGLGHAVWAAKPALGQEDFAVLLGDEIMIPTKDCPSATGDLIESSIDSGVSTVAVMVVEKSEVHKYGIIDCEEISEQLYKVHAVVEKPSNDSAPSNLALPGRYVFQNNILEILANTSPGRNGEIQLTDAMTVLASDSGLQARTVAARRYDAGDKFGYLQANIELGLEHPEISDKLRSYLKSFSERL